MDLLPADILYKIVLPLPIKFLVRFRCGCRRFYADPVIASRVKKLIEEPNILLVTSFPGSRGSDEKPRYEEDDAGFLKVSIPRVHRYPCHRLLGSCNGLMIFEGDPGVCLLVNPILEEALFLWTDPPRRSRRFHYDPYGRVCSSTRLRFDHLEHDHDPWHSTRLVLGPLMEYCDASGLGLDYVTGDYKFVLVSYDTMVLVLGTSSWRMVGCPDWWTPLGRAICIGGTLYWPNRRLSGLVTFDLAKEEYNFVSVPAFTTLVDLGNRLGVVDISPAGRIDIWELDIRTEQRTKKYEIDFPELSNLCSQPEFLENNCFEVLGMWNQKIAFRVRVTLYCYDSQNRSIEPIRCPGPPDSDTMPYCISGSPVSPYRFSL